MIKFYLLFGISIVLFYKSLFVAHSMPTTVNTETISERRFKKLIYIVLDGLRFDAFVPVNKQGRYYNNMAISTDPAIESRCFLTIAGIPTATSSRVVSLMTGAPTNPLEILQAFSSQPIRIDNLIRRSPPNTSFFGDECWPKSFVSLAGRSSVMPSYSRFDQARREDELMDELVTRIINAPNKESDQFIFAHFNTLDTYGHAFGVDHDVMRETLKRWDNYLYRIYNAMDEDTLFVALSDHGVTDRGQHGGSSARELAAFSCFFTKGASLDNNVLDTAQLSSYYQFMSKFYSIGRCNGNEDWIEARVPYNVIHQDDVVVTVSYLLGVAPPFNSYGNLIPFITRELNALKKLAALKERNPFAKEIAAGPGQDDVDCCERRNYLLTGQIYTSLTSRNWLGGFIVLLIALFLLYSHRCVEDQNRFAMVSFIIAMASHSMFAFASEDYLWLAALLCDSPSLDSLLATSFYIKAPRQMTMDRDRINICRRWGFLNLEKFPGTAGPILLSGLFILSRIFNIKRLWTHGRGGKRGGAKQPCSPSEQESFVEELWRMAPQLYYIAYSLASGREDRELKMSLLSSDPSLHSLLAIHNQPVNALYILLFLNNLDTSSSSTILYSALAFVPYCSNLDKMLQSIDYETFFVFSDEYRPALAAVSAFSYLILPRLLLLKRLCRCPPVRRRCFRFINLVGLYFAFACSWAQFEHLTFQDYFINRLFFVTFFAIIDILGLALLEVYVHRFNK